MRLFTRRPTDTEFDKLGAALAKAEIDRDALGIISDAQTEIIATRDREIASIRTQLAASEMERKAQAEHINALDETYNRERIHSVRLEEQLADADRDRYVCRLFVPWTTGDEALAKDHAQLQANLAEMQQEILRLERGDTTVRLGGRR
jgi:tRNA/tmRNA/rRNA uracil-C5-methylase (TrmA/RlmC/RlmD family)